MGAGATAAEVPSVSLSIMHVFATLYARHAGVTETRGKPREINFTFRLVFINTDKKK